MKAIWDSAPGLLLVTGGLLGLTLPFGKLATAAGVPAIVWAVVISLGAGGVLLCVLLLRGKPMMLTPHRLRYFCVTAAVSYAFPNFLMFSAISHLGAGYTGIMFTISPVVTLVFSILLGVRRPNLLGVAGIAVGFAGAAMVALTRGEAGQPAEPFWVGRWPAHSRLPRSRNIYRTVDWPRDTGPIEMAAGSHLASAAMLAGRHVLPAGGAANWAGSQRFPPSRWRRLSRPRPCSPSISGSRRSAGRYISARSAMWRRRSGCFPARCSWASTIAC